MVKKFINLLIIILLFSPIYICAQNNKEIKKYKILIKLCRQLNDKSCELKYYSYLYDVADEQLKEKIKSDVIKILARIKDKNKIKLKNFKHNWVYYKITGKEENYVNTEIFTNTPFKVLGLLIPLSGQYDFLGKQILKGIFAANIQDFKIKIFDTNNDRSNIQERFKNFIQNNYDIQIIIGPVLKSTAEALKDIFQNIRIPVIMLNDDKEIAKYSKFIFTHFINIDDEMSKLCEVLKNDEIQNTALLYPENNIGLKYKNSFFNNCDISTIHAIVPYNPGTSDFKNILFQIGKIRKIKEDIFKPENLIDSFIILDRLETALIIIPQIYFYDFKSPKIYGIDLWNSYKLNELDKKFKKNITFVDCIDYNKLKKLKKIYNNSVDFYLILAYDTINIINNLSNFNDFFTKQFFLLSGETYFDYNGISHKEMKIFRINTGGENVREKK